MFGKAFRNWLTNINDAILEMEDACRPDWLSEVCEGSLRSLCRKNGRQTTYELSEKINYNYTTEERRFWPMTFTKKLVAWRAHEVNTQHKKTRVLIAPVRIARY